MSKTPSAPAPNRGKFLVLGAPTVIALWFISSFAFPYLTNSRDVLGIFWERRQWLHAHVAGGILALLLGPVQLWLALNRRNVLVHRVLGIGYVMGVAISSSAAFYLAYTTGFGWVFGAGMAFMAVAWVLTSTFGIIAICRQILEQHRDWMIRSYIVTFGFVIFRVTVEVLGVMGVGTTVEQMTAASWFCWSVPLMMTEFVLQGRKVFARKSAKERSVTIRFSPAPKLPKPIPRPLHLKRFLE